ncbi:acyltransferase [Salinispora pacifica]|uniref:acyltransferase n=1 Tax=Salinispora pacifica TaxID=351187 RepID=UPI000487FA21|nr:acyltransferase [Salinispora pacifica]
MTEKPTPTTSRALDAPFIAESAEVAPAARLGARSRIWHHSQVDAGVRIGEDCVLGKGVHVASAAVIGNRVKIQDGCGVFGATLEDGVMLAPGVYLLEDQAPRAVNPSGHLKGRKDWRRDPVTIRYGATIGANSVIAPGVTIGRYALVGIGSVVGHDVPDHGLVMGNPARQLGWSCMCGHRLNDTLACPSCGRLYHQRPYGLSLAT